MTPSPTTSAAQGSKKPQFSKITEGQLNEFIAFLMCLSVFLLWAWLTVCYKLKVGGRENLPKQPISYVAAANHTSNLDPPIVAVAIRYHAISFMAKQELYRNWIAGRYFYAMGTFAVNREKMELSTLKSALTVLKTGRWALGIFPEGTRSEDGSVGQAKKGVAYFAHAAKVGVLPLGIVRTGPNRKHIYVQIGELIPYQEDLEAMAAKVQAEIALLVEKAQQMAR